MNEIAKTTVFASVAVVAVAVLLGFTLMSQNWLPELDPQDMLGKPLFDDFDPLAAADLEIIKYEEDTGTPVAFRVAQVGNRWSIPSHDNYPTDAKDQLAEAASSVLGLTVDSVETDNPGDHGLYGVLDPGSKDLKAGAVGVGTRVTMKDKDDKTLMNLVVGKEVTGRPELRYVRRVGQDAVYAVKVSTDKLSTKFEDWIEKDLLKLSTWDIKQFEIRDHSVDESQGVVFQRGEMILAYDDAGDPKWKMLEDKVFEQGQWVPLEMAEDEELNSDKLNEAKNALDDLKIVDVRRKPAGLSGELKAEESFSQDAEARLSLQSKGFYFAPIDDRMELVSNEGEIRCLLKDGVEYVLRFGNLAGDGPATAKDDTPDDESESAGLNRYIFVMAEFNPALVEEPELEELPSAEESADQGKAEGETTDDETTDDGAADNGAAEKKPDDAAADNAGTQEKPEADKADAESKTQEERERIEKENKRKQDEYDEKIAEGRKKVKELNDRFADWYYIISDDVYQKIHLGRDQIVKKKEKEKAEDEGTDSTADSAAAGDAAAADSADQSKRLANPLEEFESLKQEGPEGNQ
ncbi:MAG: DUF4340 domain-containing protein [Pirellulales bacterium]|nr:DUF4340 domain-containing protein [Pirellulales bacterium]